MNVAILGAGDIETTMAKTIILRWKGTKTAILHETMLIVSDRRGVILGEKGHDSWADNHRDERDG